MNSITVRDFEGKIQTINLAYITRVVWGEDEYGGVDMIYLNEGGKTGEVAIQAKSPQSVTLLEAITGVSSHFQAIDYLHGNNDE